MIDSNSLFPIGRIAKTHGYKGEVMITLDYPKEFFEECVDKAFFIKIDGILVPFFTDSIRGNSQDKAYLKFNEIDSEKEAALLCGEEVLVEKEWLAKILGVEPAELENSDERIIGYSVINITSGEKIGEVEEIMDGIEYDYLQIKDIDSNEVLVPFVDEYIDYIEEGEKGEGIPGIIYIKLPEGFLSIKH